MTKWTWAPLALVALLGAYVGLLAVLVAALLVRGMAVLSGGGL